MAKRDKNITAKNAWIKELSTEMTSILGMVLEETGIDSLASLNAIIGCKHDKYFDLKQVVFKSPDEFVANWHSMLDDFVEKGHEGSIRIKEYIDRCPSFRIYIALFLKRSFLNHFHEWSRTRPRVEDSTIWIGQNNAEYGLLVTPRFANGQWENDKSEIRAVRFNYWTIGHVLKTGLVVPCNPEGIFNFRNHEEYLTFFNNVLVRSSGSIYEKQIAQFYTEYVNSRSDPGIVPLLIPEFRYAGIASRHIYRLDFTLVNPYTQVRYGFELSPWSSHGYIAKTKAMTAAEINEAAQTNFEREMRKHKDFFKRHGIFIRIYTDGDLCDCRRLFDDEIVPLLNVDAPKPPFPFEIARKYGLA